MSGTINDINQNPARAYRLLRVKGHYEAAYDGYSDEIIAHKHRLIQSQMERMSRIQREEHSQTAR